MTIVAIDPASAAPATITRKLVEEHRRLCITARLFGVNFPLHLEPFVYAVTEKLSRDYDGGYWEFYELTNGGFYMAPASANLFGVVCENGFEGQLSADALGITACLYAYSHMAFGDDEFAETSAWHYHWLRDYMLQGHPERQGILRAID